MPKISSLIPVLLLVGLDISPARAGELPEGAVARVGSPRFRHANQLWAARFSPDGSTIVTGEQNVGLNLWDVATGTLKRRIVLETSRICDVAFSADCKTLALVDGNGVFRKIDSETGRELSATKFVGGARSVAMAPDGRGFAIARADRTLRLHDENGAEVRELTPSAAPLFLAYSSDGKRIATAGNDPHVDVHATDSGKLIEPIDLGDGKAGQPAFGPDGKTLAIAYTDKLQVALWDLVGHKVRRTLSPPGRVLSLAISADGRWLTWSGSIWGVPVIDLETGEERGRLPLESSVFRVVFSPDGKTVLVDPPGHGLVLWDVENRRALPQSAYPQLFVTRLAFRDDGRLVTSAERIRVHDWRAGRVPSAIPRPGMLSPDGIRAVVRQADRKHALLDVLTGEPSAGMTIPPEQLTQPQFSMEGNKLISESNRGSPAYVWDIASGKSTILDRPEAGQIFSTAVSPDGRFLIGSHRGVTRPTGVTLQVWDLSERRVVRTIEQWKDSAFGLVFSPDGRWLAAPHDLAVRKDQSGAGQADMRLWDFASGRPYRRFTWAAPRTGLAEFSRDSRTVATAADDAVVLWEISSGRERTRLPTSGGVMAYAFSRDGRYLAVSDWLSPVLIWDLHAAKLPATAAESDRLWFDLTGENATAADVARRRLLAAPELAVSLVRERLKPPADDSDRIRALIKDLDDPHFDTRQKAVTELEEFDERAEVLLRAALENTTSPEVRRRLQRLLERDERPMPQPLVAAGRVVELLEQLATPAARELLERFAGGPKTAFTRDAKASVQRLKGKP